MGGAVLCLPNVSVLVFGAMSILRGRREVWNVVLPDRCRTLDAFSSNVAGVAHFDVATISISKRL